TRGWLGLAASFELSSRRPGPTCECRHSGDFFQSPARRIFAAGLRPNRGTGIQSAFVSQPIPGPGSPCCPLIAPRQRNQAGDIGEGEMKTLVSSLICVIWTMAVAAAQSPSPATGNFLIIGVVVHSLTGQPLPGIQMSILRAQTPDVLQTVVAADRGRFAFPVSDPGKYVLVAQGRGFPRQAWDEHNGFSTAVVVGPGKDSENIVFRVRPEASVSGTVTDEANEPVREAQVMLFHRGVEEGNDEIHLRTQTSTDDQGHYRFAHLFSGTFFIVVSAQPWYAH